MSEDESVKGDYDWPITVQDRDGLPIYLTEERWDHALEHPGMSDELLECVLDTLRKGRRRQDKYDPAKYKYSRSLSDLPFDYTHVVVVVKFGWRRDVPEQPNNFALTAYLIQKLQQ